MEMSLWLGYHMQTRVIIAIKSFSLFEIGMAICFRV